MKIYVVATKNDGYPEDVELRIAGADMLLDMAQSAAEEATVARWVAERSERIIEKGRAWADIWKYDNDQQCYVRELRIAYRYRGDHSPNLTEYTDTYTAYVYPTELGQMRSVPEKRPSIVPEGGVSTVSSEAEVFNQIAAMVGIPPLRGGDYFTLRVLDAILALGYRLTDLRRDLTQHFLYRTHQIPKQDAPEDY